MGAAIMQTAQAQDSGGTQIGLTLSPGLFYEEDETRARLGFGAVYETGTRNQQFSLGFDGAFDSGYDDLADVLRSPRVTLSYGLENRSTALDATISYRRDQISALVFNEISQSDQIDVLLFGDNANSDFLVIGTGQRADLNASTSLTFGREAPFGGTLKLGYRARSYLDTVDPALLDEETSSAGLSLRFVIDPRVTARLSGSIAETDVDDPGTDQRRTSLSAGLDMAVNRALDVSLDVGATQITSTTPLDAETTEEGTSAALSATRALPNGTLSGRINSDVTVGGRLTTLQVDRALDLPRGGSLGFGGGIGQVDDGDLQALARLSWSDETPTARYSVTLDRALAVDGDGDGAVNSQLSLSWQQDLDRVSTFGAGLALRNTDRLDSGADTSRTNLSLTWRRDLTRDWGVRTTYTHSWSRETGTEDTDNYTVFLGLERDFQWRP